ncbi:cupin domain-containing protein [Sphingomonas sp.]|uniref:cupin domain-containing protein n=1 Tax=Sphingomonas sp. TaxID=28214 RepID=UPI002EDA47EE
MASERDEELRESARNRGLRLVKSRRRKAGGDFGKYGLKDAEGKELLGFGEAGLTASADEIETYLRGAMRSDWKEAAKGLPKRKPPPKPKAPPKPKLKKLKVANLFAKLPSAKRAEVFTELLAQGGVRIERIVSNGQATPEDKAFLQDADEWVVVLQGSAAIRLEGYAEAALAPGDHLLIPGGTRHWVTRTDPGAPTVWLAVHIG